MGLEPTTSAVTGRHSNQLNYRAVLGDAYGIRTREAAVKGRCLNHLTNAPYNMNGGGHPRGGIRRTLTKAIIWDFWPLVNIFYLRYNISVL